MTSLLHRFPDTDPCGQRIQHSEQDDFISTDRPDHYCRK